MLSFALYTHLQLTRSIHLAARPRCEAGWWSASSSSGRNILREPAALSVVSIERVKEKRASVSDDASCSCTKICSVSIAAK